MKVFAWFKSKFNQLEARWIMWRTQRILKAVDRKLAKHAELQQALKEQEK